MSCPRTTKTGGAKLSHGKQQTGQDHHGDRFQPGKVSGKASNVDELVGSLQPVTPNLLILFLLFSPLMVRKINDQLMLLDRAFLDPLAFPEKYAFRYQMSPLKKALTVKM